MLSAKALYLRDLGEDGDRKYKLSNGIPSRENARLVGDSKWKLYFYPKID